jgi:hypothetical protein
MRRPVIVNEAAAVMRDDDEDVQHPERARRNPKTEFQQQFVRDSFLAPERVFMRHPAAQPAQLFWNREPPRPRLPPPQEPKKQRGASESAFRVARQPVPHANRTSVKEMPTCPWRLCAEPNYNAAR